MQYQNYDMNIVYSDIIINQLTLLTENPSLVAIVSTIVSQLKVDS